MTKCSDLALNAASPPFAHGLFPQSVTNRMVNPTHDHTPLENNKCKEAAARQRHVIWLLCLVPSIASVVLMFIADDNGRVREVSTLLVTLYIDSDNAVSHICDFRPPSLSIWLCCVWKLYIPCFGVTDLIQSPGRNLGGGHDALAPCLPKLSQDVV